MSILDYTPPTEEITSNGKLLMKVRGLSLEDLSHLIRDHLDDINRMVELNQGAQAEVFAKLQTDGFLLKLMTDIPIVMCEAIARSAGQFNNETVDAIMRLPFSLQLLAIRAVVRLTLEDVGGPKGLAALVRNLMTS